MQSLIKRSKVNFLSRCSPVFFPWNQNTLIYLIDLREIKKNEVVEAIGLLNDSSFKRCMLKKRVIDQYRCMITHASLRFFLSSFLEINPNKIFISYTESGKPYIAKNKVFFSLSHSIDYAAIAFNKDNQIGIDIEKARNIPNLLDVSRSFMSNEEMKYFSNVDIGQIQRFFCTWVCKEAYLKAHDIPFDLLKEITFPNLHCNKFFEEFGYKNSKLALCNGIVRNYKISVCLSII